MEGMHADVPKVIKMCPTNTEEDLRNLNKRIESYGKKVCKTNMNYNLRIISLYI